MSDDQQGRGMPHMPGSWETIPPDGTGPQHAGEEYDADATAFVQLPDGAADIPLAAPGHGYVPPQIPFTPVPATDPGATGDWIIPNTAVPSGETVRWPEPGAQAQPAPDGYPQDPYASAPHLSDPYQAAMGHPRPDGYPEAAHQQAAADIYPHGAQVPGPDTYPQAGIDPFDASEAFGAQGVPGDNPGVGQQSIGDAFPGVQDPGHDQGQGLAAGPVSGPVPGMTGQWDFSDVSAGPVGAGQYADTPAPGPSDVTGQWSVPVADGDVPEESGEFTTSSLAAQWGTNAPATLPGGAPAPWATGAVPTGPDTGRHWDARPETAAPETEQTGPEAPSQPQPQQQPQSHERAYEQTYGQQPGAMPGPEAHPHGPDAHPHGVVGGAEHDGPVDTAQAPQDVRPAADHGDGTDARGADFGTAPAVTQVEGGPGTAPYEGAPADAPVEPEAATAPSEPADGSEARDTGAPGATGAQDPDADPAGPADAPEAHDAAEPVGVHGPPETDAPAVAAPAFNDEHPLASYVLRVNGADRPVTDAWIGESLLYVLRERLGLAGAKDGCSQGECGACAVQVDGRVVASCLVPAATSAGSEVRTVEGLAEGADGAEGGPGQPSDVQRALAKCGAVQCGFCVPGMAMTIHDLLEGNPDPTELEARQALSGNLCRCSGYRGILDAVRDVVAEREASASASAAASADAQSEEAHGTEGRIPHQAGPGDGGAHQDAPHPDQQPHVHPQSRGQHPDEHPDGGQA